MAFEVIENIISNRIPQKGLYNVNIPKIAIAKYKGLKACRQAKAKWNENFIDRLDPQGKKYFWLTGEFQNLDKGKDTDVWALEHNYASIVPVQYDLTNYSLLESIQL